MIKVHAFFSNNFFDGGAFVFQHPDGDCYTFNSKCWEDGKPVLRKVEKLEYDIMGITSRSRYEGWDHASLLNIVMDNGEEFTTCIDVYYEHMAYGDYWLGVMNAPNEAMASAFGGHATVSRGWSISHGVCTLVEYVPLRLDKLGVQYGREHGSNTAYLERFGWVLDYSTGKLIEGCGTENQLVNSS